MSPNGLTCADAAARLVANGPNRLPSPPSPHVWLKLAGQFSHFFAAMLWLAGLLALIAGMPQLGIAIFVVIVVNGVFAFVQEQRAERAAERLQDLLPVGVVVRRDGQPQTIDAADVVVGDLVVLSPGDRVPADLTLVAADGVAVDASTLTGESVPMPLGVGDRAFAGTYVTSGAANGVVDATGAMTQLAGIAQLTSTARHPRTPLARELNRIVRTVATIAVIAGTAFFGISLLIGSPTRDGFLFAVGVTVALVPEGLLPTVTLSLAMGAQRMAKRNALALSAGHSFRGGRPMTIVVTTDDLRPWLGSNRKFAVINRKSFSMIGTREELTASADPLVRELLSGETAASSETDIVNRKS